MINRVHRAVAEGWTASALPSLAEYVEIPALSPDFDASWADDRAPARGRRARPGLDRRPRDSGREVRDPRTGRALAAAGGRRARDPGAAAQGTVAPVRPPRQAAPGRRLVRRARPVDPWCATAGCTAAARSTTATRATRRRSRSRPCTRPAASTPGRCCCWRPARSPGARTCPRTWSTWPAGSATCRWWCAWTRAAATTSGCG